MKVWVVECYFRGVGWRPLSGTGTRDWAIETASKLSRSKYRRYRVRRLDFV